MRTIVALALVLSLVGGWPENAEARNGTIIGSWVFDVTPQAVLPEFPVPPPPFVSIFNFELARTVVEADSSIHPGSMLTLFPPDVLPAVSASDGYGAWKRTGRNRFRCTFLKILFDLDGTQVGFIKTTLKLVLNRDGTLEGEGASDFILGPDPSADAFFTGPVTLEGTRLRVEEW